MVISSSSSYQLSAYALDNVSDSVSVTSDLNGLGCVGLFGVTLYSMYDLCGSGLRYGSLEMMVLQCFPFA